MSPPGRRKSCSLFFLAFLGFLFFASTASAASAVLGIDLGTEYIKAAIAKPGSPIDIVLTKDSKRKEAASLAFKPSRSQTNDKDAYPERLYGGDALALAARYPGDVYPNLKTLLGVPFDSERITTYTSRYPGLEVEEFKRLEDKSAAGTVAFKSKNIGERGEAFMVEELLAMELQNIRANAEAAAGKGFTVSDVVITYPAFYTAQEKRAIELAADLADLRVVGLMSDGLAVGLNYATTRTFDSVTDGAKPEYHLVYDMGAGSTTATVLKFQGRTIKGPGKKNQTVQEVYVVGTGYDKTLGGDLLNDLIVDDMIATFVEQPKMKKLNVQSADLKSGKSMARIWKEAERIRQVLSANSAAHASFEGLYDDDVNVKYSLTRDRFEELAQAHAARVGNPLYQAIAEAEIALADLDSVILHGGVVRTPFAQKQLEISAGGAAKIKTNVNADEAAALGAAFKSAAISPSFRVKDIRTYDISGSAVILKWTSEGEERQQKLFTPTSQLGAEKQVPIKVLEDTKFQFVESSISELPVVEVEASNLTKSVAELKDKHGCTAANISTIFNIRLNPRDGLPEFVSSSVSCQSEAGKDGGVLDNVKGLFGFGGKKTDDQKPLIDDESGAEDPTALTPELLSDPTSSGSTMSAASASEDVASNAEDPAKATASTKPPQPKATTVTIPLAFKARALGLTTPPKASLPRLRQRLTEFSASDRNMMLRSEALNTLEAFTYRARDYLEDTIFVSVSSEQSRKELSEQLSAVSEWLYGDGVDAKLQDFKDKLKNLRSLVDPVLKRKDENSKRDAAVEALNKGLESMKGTLQMMESSVVKAQEEAASRASMGSMSESPSASSASPSDDLEEDPYSPTQEAADSTTDVPAFKPYEYTQEDISPLSQSYEAAKKWLEEKLAAQQKLGPYDDPVVLVGELESKAKQLQDQATKVIMKSIKMPEIPKKGKGEKKSNSKTKKPAKASKTGSETEAEASSTTKDIKDEL